MRRTILLPALILFGVVLSSGSETGGNVLVVLHKFDNFLGYYDVATGQELARIPTGKFPHELCLSPDRTRIYVTEYGERGVDVAGPGGNTIGVFDLRQKKRVGTISTGRYNRPHGIVARAGKLFATSEPTKTLLIYDLGTGQLLHAVSTGQQTSHMVNVAPDGRTAYTANIGSNSLTAIDAASGKVLKQIPVLTRPEGMAFSPDGTLLYVVNRESKAIAIIDTGKKEMIGKIETGNGPVRIAITPDGKHLAFPLFHADAVQVADTATRKVTQTIAVGRQPAGTTISRDGKLLFVSCELERTVYVVSLDSYRVVNKISTGNGPDAMACLEASEVK